MLKCFVKAPPLAFFFHPATWPVAYSQSQKNFTGVFMIGANERLDVAGFYFVKNCNISCRAIYNFFLCVETVGFAKLLGTFLCVFVSCLKGR